MRIVDREILPVVHAVGLLKSSIEINECTHEYQTDETIGAKSNISAEWRSEETTKQSSTTASKTKMKTL